MSNYTISVPASSIQKAISYGANVSVTGSGVSFPDGTTVTSVASSVIVPDLAYAQANVATGIATGAYTQANAGIAFTQGVYDFANTIGGGSAIDNVARQIAISARANTIIIQGVNETQNTWISSNVTSLQSQISANVNSLNGINDTQNTRIQSIETINTNQNTSISIIQGVDNTQNVEIAGIQGVDLAQNTSISTLNSQIITNQGINDNQNTKIQSIETINNDQNNTIIQVNQFAAGAFDFANVSSGIQSGINETQNTAISIIQGVDLGQNTTITQVNQFTQSAYNQANTGTVLAQAAFNYANTISSSGTSIDSFARTTANTAIASNAATDGKMQSAYDQANTTAGGLLTANSNITSVNQYAASSYNLANTNANAIAVIQGVDLGQNNTITAVNSFTQSAYNKANNALANTSGVLFGGNLNISNNLIVGAANASFYSQLSYVNPKMSVNGSILSVGNAGDFANTSLLISTFGGTANQRSSISLFSTFNSFQLSDTSPRKTVDIIAGFANTWGAFGNAPGTWGNEYLSINVGNNGVSNDSANVTSEKMRITSNGTVGIGTSNPLVTLDMSSRTDAIALPSGNTAQRPISAVAGMQRWNTTLGCMEYYNGSSWAQKFVLSYTIEYVALGGGGGGGGGDIATGGAGASGGIVYGSSTVYSTDILNIYVGGGGVGGLGARAGDGAGAGGSNGGGRGGNAGGDGTSGGGGGGGGWSGIVYVSDLAIAGGGGGGGGSNEDVQNDVASGGGGNQPRGSQASGIYSGAQGFDYSGDGGGGGGGGGGRYGGIGQAQSVSLGASGGGNYTNGGTSVNGNNGAAASGTTTTVPAVSGQWWTFNSGYGQGGGGAGGSGNGASGGQGQVIIRYVGTPRGTGGTITQSGGYTYHTITSTGTFEA